jgi:hypothetical protein
MEPEAERRAFVQPDDAREPELRRQLTHLSERMDMLEGAAGALIARLAPVLVSEPPTEKVEAELAEVVQTEYASEIHKQAMRAHAIMRRLDSALHRLEA